MPKGALTEDIGVETSLAKLRDLVRELELEVSRLAGAGEEALDVLHLRDRIEDELALRRAAHQDVRAEETRVQTVDNILERRAPLLMSELRSIGGLPGIRQRENPPEERWWYYLDLEVGEKRRKSAIRTSITIVAILVAVLGINFVMNRLSGLTPEEKVARGHMGSAEQAIVAGNVDEAITYYELALETDPSLGSAHASLGVLYELSGRTREAEASLAKARELIPELVQYLATVARAYETVGLTDKALDTIEQALEIDPDSAQATFIRGGIHESMGDSQQAIADFERASELARASGEDALYVLARTRMAMLMQRSPSGGLGGF